MLWQVLIFLTFAAAGAIVLADTFLSRAGRPRRNWLVIACNAALVIGAASAIIQFYQSS